MIPDLPSDPARFQGAIVGTACGDALGLPVEGQPRTAARRHADRLRRVLRSPAAQNRLWFSQVGQYSDDGQQARLLVEVLHEHGRVVPDAFAARLVALWRRPGAAVGWGHGTAAALARMTAGIHWREAAAPVGLCGNGSAMRVVPLGVWFARDGNEAVTSEADLQSRVTHADDRAAAAAIVLAHAAADATRVEPTTLVDGSSAWAKEVEALDPRLAEAVRALPTVLDHAPDDAIRWACASNPDLDCPPHERGIPGTAPPTALFALWCWLRHPHDFVTAVTESIEAGGDVDTIAAIVGGLVGATAGVAAIPATITDVIHDRGRHRARDLGALAADAWHRHRT